MANPEQLKILEQGVEIWNKWREENPDIEINLSNAYLSNTSLSDANLSNANLSNAYLSNTSLRNAYLSNANLSNADLIYANLINANLNYANLIYANLNYAKLFDTNLINADLRNTNLDNADLRNTNLDNANLNYAKLFNADLIYANLNNADLRNTNLSNADLSNANLSNANLSNAELRIVKALATNFSSATLTGACIKDWNINSKTKLDNVICDYIYLSSKINWDYDEGAYYRERYERRPSDPNKNFKPGEFTKLFQKALETVDLIFLDGIDWQAFLTSFQKLQVESNNDELAIQAIERKTDGAFVVRVEVPPDANKADIEQYLKQEYEIELKAIEDKYRLELNAKDREIEIYKQQNTNIFEIAKLAASRPIQNIIDITNKAENKSMSDTFNNDLQGANIANFANQVKDNARQQANQYNYTSEQKQTLAEAAKEIQNLLKQLEQTNPNATEAEKIAYVNDETTPSFKRRVAGALKAAGEAAIDEFLDNPYVKVGKAAIMGWIEAGN